jgi:hypothetical protein
MDECSCDISDHHPKPAGNVTSMNTGYLVTTAVKEAPVDEDLF